MTGCHYFSEIDFSCDDPTWSSAVLDRYRDPLHGASPESVGVLLREVFLAFGVGASNEVRLNLAEQVAKTVFASTRSIYPELDFSWVDEFFQNEPGTDLQAYFAALITPAHRLRRMTEERLVNGCADETVRSKIERQLS